MGQYPAHALQRARLDLCFVVQAEYGEDMLQRLCGVFRQSPGDDEGGVEGNGGGE